MKLTEHHISDEHLNIMIDWMERTQAYQALDALLELKQRRAEDRQRRNSRGRIRDSLKKQVCRQTVGVPQSRSSSGDSFCLGYQGTNEENTHVRCWW